jgi:hypothetical protein
MSPSDDATSGSSKEVLSIVLNLVLQVRNVVLDLVRVRDELGALWRRIQNPR